MSSGVVLFPNPQAINAIDDVVAQAYRAYDLGVRQVWLGQQHDHDAITLAALVGAAAPGLGVGTSVCRSTRVTRCSSRR
ncbi:alkanesulfonate monooxygenase SsuD/methylene tetrahydromethanopterin reductase-like flavin-dependent oxidoreductase (luciferase family) [Mycobacterium sp. URHB0021]|jgi:alkanesulfonate monooxygenase SsuD/methylene tetrahydromethanopterin reductase-like flavin-dependent oxidoreductase (luciferase family)